MAKKAARAILLNFILKAFVSACENIWEKGWLEIEVDWRLRLIGVSAGGKWEIMKNGTWALFIVWRFTGRLSPALGPQCLQSILACHCQYFFFIENKAGKSWFNAHIATITKTKASEQKTYGLLVLPWVCHVGQKRSHFHVLLELFIPYWKKVTESHPRGPCGPDRE